MSMSSARAGATSAQRSEDEREGARSRGVGKGSHGVSPVIQGQALAVSVVRERTATPWLTAAVAWLRGSLTTALTFHSLSAHRESPVAGAAPAVSIPGFCAVLEPRQARSPGDAGSSSLTFRTRTR